MPFVNSGIKELGGGGMITPHKRFVNLILDLAKIERHLCDLDEKKVILQ